MSYHALWAELCLTPIICHLSVEALHPSAPDVTVFGGRAFKEVIKLK